MAWIFRQPVILLSDVLEALQRAFDLFTLFSRPEAFEMLLEWQSSVYLGQKLHLVTWLWILLELLRLRLGYLFFFFF